MNASQRARRIATLRRWHADAIDENPATIEFDAERLVSDGDGAGVVTNPHIGPITVRVYQDRYARETVQQPAGATRNIGQRWGMLAPYDADLRGDPNDGDVFTHPDGNFRVREVFHHRLGPRIPDDVWGIECDIVRLA